MSKVRYVRLAGGGRFSILPWRQLTNTAKLVVIDINRSVWNTLGCESLGAEKVPMYGAMSLTK